jgi:hypothetical protein
MPLRRLNVAARYPALGQHALDLILLLGQCWPLLSWNRWSRWNCRPWRPGLPATKSDSPFSRQKKIALSLSRLRAESRYFLRSTGHFLPRPAMGSGKCPPAEATSISIPARTRLAHLDIRFREGKAWPTRNPPSAIRFPFPYSLHVLLDLPLDFPIPPSLTCSRRSCRSRAFSQIDAKLFEGDGCSV